MSIGAKSNLWPRRSLILRGRRGLPFVREVATCSVRRTTMGSSRAGLIVPRGAQRAAHCGKRSDPLRHAEQCPSLSWIMHGTQMRRVGTGMPVSPSEGVSAKGARWCCDAVIRDSLVALSLSWHTATILFQQHIRHSLCRRRGNSDLAHHQSLP